LENLKGRVHSNVLKVDGKIILIVLKEIVLRMWNGFIWLTAATGGGLLRK
jgi:hypothetical protein